MSFLKITDPAKRDLIIAEYLKTKRNIQDDQLAERLGEQVSLSSLTKQFKPITDVQKDLTQSILSEIKPIKKGLDEQTSLLQDIPKALVFPHIPAIEDEDEKPEMIGNIAASYLRKFATKDADKVYGIYDKNGQFYIGDKQVGVIDDNIIVGDKEYLGTPGLWELIVMRVPSENIYTQEDYENYAEIMSKTNALRQGNDRNQARPKASKGWKWKYLLKDIWNERGQFSGEGVQPPTVILPSDPNALLERLDLLMASKVAGNTGVRNELISVCDELKRQGVIDVKSYKKLMLIL